MALGDPYPYKLKYDDNFLKLGDDFLADFQKKMCEKIDRNIYESLNYVQIIDPSGTMNRNTTFWTVANDTPPITPMKFHKRYSNIKCYKCGKFFKDMDMGIQACPSCGIFG